MEIDKLISENKISEAINQCVITNSTNLGILIGKVAEQNNLLSESDKQSLNKMSKPKIRILLACNWSDSKSICDLWNRMSKNNDYSWDKIQIVWEEPCDYYCIINKPFDDSLKYIPEKTIIFRMEPKMETKTFLWGDFWSKPNEKDFKFVGYHEKHFNNNEWHLSKNYSQLLSEPIIKNNDLSFTLSTILSSKYVDPGHIKRNDFMKFFENKGCLDVHVFGQNRFLWKNYKGSLPPHKKDDSLFPYKYSFNVENFSIKNYYTEKLIDGILSETLVFYSGCYNIKEFIDERAFVYLELSNFENDYEIIKSAIMNDLWSERIEYIREAKKKILNELQFFPRLEKIVCQ
jgi:hypothetical protein